MGKKDKSKIFNNMKNLLDSTNLKVEKKEPTKNIDSIENDIKKVLDMEVFKTLTEDEEVSNFLMNSSLDLFKVQAKNAIELGKIFKNVFDKLGGEGSKYTGLYEKWLSLNGVSKSTALRYRKRYELYIEVASEKKSMVAILAQKYIDMIYSEENTGKYISIINSSETVKDIIQNIELNKIDLITEPQEEIFVYNPKIFKFPKEINNKIENLDSRKKKELLKYFERIEKILSE